MKNKISNTKQVICVECKELYTKNSVPRKFKKYRTGVRGYNTITCSPRCSAKWNNPKAIRKRKEKKNDR